MTNKVFVATCYGSIHVSDSSGQDHTHTSSSAYIPQKHLKTTRLCLIFSSFLFTKPSLISSVWRVEYCFLVLALLKVSAPCVGRQTYRRHSPPNLPVFESHTACTTNLRTSDDSESLPSPPETRRFWSPPGSSAVTRPSSFLSEFQGDELRRDLWQHDTAEASVERSVSPTGKRRNGFRRNPPTPLLVLKREMGEVPVSPVC